MFYTKLSQIYRNHDNICEFSIVLNKNYACHRLCAPQEQMYNFLRINNILILLKSRVISVLKKHIYL